MSTLFLTQYFEDALALNMQIHGKRMLETIGNRIVHAFDYEKLSDMRSFKRKNDAKICKSVYGHLDLSNACSKQAPDFDTSTQIAIMIRLHSSPRKITKTYVVSVEDVREASQIGNYETEYVMSNQQQHARCCNHCGKTHHSDPGVALLLCGRCKCVRYCSKECQVTDWPRHKGVCKRIETYSKE